MVHPKRPIASVFGSSKESSENDPEYLEARSLGRRLAEAGYAVATGGYHGTMEAISRGARESGGHVIGVTTAVFDHVRPGPNPFVLEEIKFPTLFQRLHHLVTFADAWVALPGGIGTLSEVALTWSLLQVGELGRKPFVVVGPMWRDLLQGFTRNGYVPSRYADLIRYADTVAEVVTLLKDRA